jgi:hypothetical protein
MSLLCAKENCKAKPGMCNCEKIGAAVIALITVALLAKHLL